MTRDFFFCLTQWGCWKGGKTCTCDKLLLGYMSWSLLSKQWKRRLSSRSWKSSPQVLFIYEVLWLSRSTSQSALPAWLICFGEASALHSVSGHKGPAKQLDGSSGYTVRILNGFSEMKGSVHLTEIQLFVFIFQTTGVRRRELTEEKSNIVSCYCCTLFIPYPHFQVLFHILSGLITKTIQSLFYSNNGERHLFKQKKYLLNTLLFCMKSIGYNIQHFVTLRT